MIDHGGVKECDNGDVGRTESRRENNEERETRGEYGKRKPISHPWWQNE